MPRVPIGSLFLIGLLMTLGAIIACGGSATVEPAPRFTPGVAATATPDTSEKMEGTKAPVAKATKAMERMSGPVEQAGTVVVAMRKLRAGADTPRFCTAGCSETIYQLAIGETITAVEAGPGGVLDPRDTARLALSWELSPDQKYMDFKLREGVKFHKDYGEMTAEDVAFSYNDANAFTTPESIHGQAGDFAPLIANVEALDPYNVRFHFTLFQQAMPMRYVGPFYQSAAIVPKSAFDRHGVEGMRDIFIGAGPFIFDEWKKSESLTAHSVTEHYRKVPAIKDVRILDIPEAAARVAMLETGDAQIGGELPFEDFVRLQRKGFELQRENGLAHERGLFFSGNYWET